MLQRTNISHIIVLLFSSSFFFFFFFLRDYHDLFLKSPVNLHSLGTILLYIELYMCHILYGHIGDHTSRCKIGNLHCHLYLHLHYISTLSRYVCHMYSWMCIHVNVCKCVDNQYNPLKNREHFFLSSL